MLMLMKCTRTPTRRHGWIYVLHTCFVVHCVAATRAFSSIVSFGPPPVVKAAADSIVISQPRGVFSTPMWMYVDPRPHLALTEETDVVSLRVRLGATIHLESCCPIAGAAAAMVPVAITGIVLQTCVRTISSFYPSRQRSFFCDHKLTKYLIHISENENHGTGESIADTNTNKKSLPISLAS